MPPRISISGITDPDSTAKDKGEEEIALFFGEQFEIQLQEIIDGINAEDPQSPDNDFWARWAGIFLAFLIPEFTRFQLEGAETQQGQINIGVDFDLIQDNAANFASTFAFSLVSDINLSSRKFVENALFEFTKLPADQRKLTDIAALLANKFNPSRAENIAITETTRLFSQGARSYSDELNRIGVVTDFLWHTKNDEKVCPICEPNHEVLKSSGQWTVDWIPAHPRERCWIETVLV